jgi:hypothetical protein
MPDGEPRSASTVSFEPPDLTHWKFVGDVTEAEMRVLTALEKALVEGRPYLLKLVDLSQIGKVTPGGRKAGAEKVHDVPVRGVAIYGASFGIRVLAELVARAGDFLRRIKDTPTRFFATEAEARAFIESRRAAIEQSRISATSLPSNRASRP